jgi:uncharacterized protein YjbI with pentapeptide repeats
MTAQEDVGRQAGGQGDAKPRCKYDGCERPPYDQDGRCICHSRRPDKNLSGFELEIRTMLSDKNYDFSGFVFPVKMDFSKREFEAPVKFASSVFRGLVSFERTTLKGGADFRNAEFIGDADFGHAVFENEADFRDARFQYHANFQCAQFQGRAKFDHARFQLSDASSRCDTYFSKATFECPVNFTRAKFHGAVHFTGVTFRDAALFVGDEDDWIFSDQRDAGFTLVRFEQPHLVEFQHVCLKRARFLSTDVRKVRFTDVEWAKRPRGRPAVWDELGPEPDGKKDCAMIGWLYRQLKYNYEEQRDPIPAGDFHFGEMRMRRLDRPPKNWLWRFRKRNLSFLALYQWVSGYGEDYRRPLVWIVGIIALFGTAFAYWSPFALEPMKPGFWHQLWRGLLYSIMCFLLRPDRPYRPVHIAGQYLSVAEGVIGASLLAMFLLALNRRFKR